ncbi:hypoxanthine phosphoribosyltransferase [Pedobacter sp. L105]|uniref:hypoxanthine phosphoribosyltransferase n=1 Tax=Pedobacter sp. L105 TaxID=1641871 RepID=UPI00131C072D|nr:hypoxanthine phosphoribosyltransferase [Pedobacter sp. L105]
MSTIEVGDKMFSRFIPNDDINKRTRLIGIQLNIDYEDKCPVFIGVLNGSFLFMADLLKEVDVPCEVGFIKISSYEGTESKAVIKEAFGLPDNLHNRHVVLVEDIVDTGFTLTYLLEKVYLQQPASIRVCTLLYKPAAIQTSIKELEYIGFEIPNNFVVGYGLDYNGLGRNLKDIYSLVQDGDSLH